MFDNLVKNKNTNTKIIVNIYSLLLCSILSTKSFNNNILSNSSGKHRVQHYYYPTYQIDKLLCYFLWAPNVPSEFCFVCWDLDSANILCQLTSDTSANRGSERETEKQEEGRSNSLIRMCNVSSVAGHLKLQPAFSLSWHSQCHWSFSDISVSIGSAPTAKVRVLAPSGSSQLFLWALFW